MQNNRNSGVTPVQGVVVALLVWLFLGLAASGASAQEIRGLTDPFSPLSMLPPLQAEFRVRGLAMQVTRGSITNSTLVSSASLREKLKMNKTFLFLDNMLRLQGGRLSLRVHLEPREFVGREVDLLSPGVPTAEARLDFTGWRIGGDVDIFRYGRSRFGLNADYHLHPIHFSDAIFFPGPGVRLSGTELITVGVHGFYNPVTTFYGVTGVVEGRVRWALTRTDLTDIELSAGIVFPETVFGRMSLKGGYRSTSLEITEKPYNIDVSFSGIFGELAYYY
jgi:hypothetical protein